MDRISKTRSVIRVVTVIFSTLLIVFIVNFCIHVYRTNAYNRELRTIDNFSDATDVVVDIHARGMATDSWEKDNAFPDVLLKAKIYEATVTNSTGSLLHDWNLRIDIQKDCYINNAWNGTVEIHQFDDGVENIETLSLQNYKTSDITLDYYLCGQDLLIPLSKGDYIVYYPSNSDSNNENEIESTDTMVGEMNVGVIFYSLTGTEDLSQFTMNYYLQKSIWQGTEARIFTVGIAIWFVSMIISFTVLGLTARYERRIKRQFNITNEFLEVFANYVDSKEYGVGGHSKDVANWSKALALKMGMNKEDADNVYYAALVHDIGNCYVPEYILKKTSNLTNDEYELIKMHTVKGAEMLNGCKSIAHLADGALYHHERYDGTGYPTEKAGETIPLIGRIICIADCYSVMSHGKSYKNMEDEETIISELEQGKGTQFDPVLVDAFVELLRENTMENWEIE